jgi:hypothetical protein
MGLLTGLLAMPFKGPVDGALWVATKVTEAAEAKMNDKSMLRTMLRDAEKALLAGEIDEDAYDEIETDILLRLKAARE